MAANHLDNIVITLTLAAAASPQAGFGNMLFIGDEASGFTLGGDRVRSYTDTDGVATDVTGGDLPAAANTLAAVAFAQNPRPQTLKIGRADTGGGETYADAYAACKVADAAFYGVAIESRADADILAIATPVQADNRVLFVQSDDSDWRTSGYPSGLTALEGDENTFVAYHDEDSEYFDLGWGCGILAFDPDVQSAPWNRPVSQVAAYTTAPTDTEKGFLDGNQANHGLPLAGATFHVDPGVNCNNRPGYEILTADWFATRLEEAVAALVVAKSTAGEKITIDARGGALIQALIEQILGQGVDANHFLSDWVVEMETITAADKAAQRIRFSVQATHAVSARVFNFTVNLSR